jgi:hypothetical protein
MGLSKSLALSAIVFARVTAGLDVSQSCGGTSVAGIRCSTCIRRTSHFLSLFFHFYFELEMVPVRGFAKGWTLPFSGIAA